MISEERKARIDKATSDHQRRVSVLLDAIQANPNSLPEFFSYVSDEYQLKEFDSQGVEIDAHLSNDSVLRAQAWAYLASDKRFTGREHVIFKTSFPRELKLTPSPAGPILLSRMIWFEATVTVFHPAIEEIWEFAVTALDKATIEAGERVLLSPGKPRNAWKAFTQAFFPEVLKTESLSAKDFRLRLIIEKRRGKWFIFEE